MGYWSEVGMVVRTACCAEVMGAWSHFSVRSRCQDRGQGVLGSGGASGRCVGLQLWLELALGTR
jgi:hypothetical protein